MSELSNSLNSLVSALGMVLTLFVSASPTSAQIFVVSQNNPGASDQNPGTEGKPFKTIQAAAAIAEPGDTVVVHRGIYREQVAPAKGGTAEKSIRYIAAEPGQVIVRGSEVFTGKWEKLAAGPNSWIGRLDPVMLKSYNPFAVPVRASRGGGTQGQVFVNGLQLAQEGTSKRLPDEHGSWQASADGLSLTLNLPQAAKDPNQSIVELSVRMRVFAPIIRGLAHIHVQGFVFEQAANLVAVPQMGMVSMRSGNHWAFENNVVRFARGIGLECGAEWGIEKVPGETDKRRMRDFPEAGRHLIRNNYFTDNEQCGLAGLRSVETRILGNIVERNGRGVPGFESGGIKAHFFWDGLCEGNLVRDNEAYGIWLDNDCAGARVTRNLVIDNTPNGIFLELVKANRPAIIVDNNVIVANRGDGIYDHDASGVSVFHNLILNNTNFGVYMHVATKRVDGISRERVFNNLLANNQVGELSFPLPGGKTGDNLSDCNLVSPPTSRPAALVVNPNNGTKVGTDQIAQEARKAFEASGDPGLAEGQLNQFKAEAPTLTLPQWRAMMDNDLNTQAGKLEGRLDAKTLTLVLVADNTVAKVATQPQDRQDKDYLGRQLPKEKPLPGPFQDLKAGENHYNLWPVEGCGQPTINPPQP
jgi:Right handed beta helix region